MKLNLQLKEIFKEYNINPSEGIMCLLAIYHGVGLSGELERVLQPTMMQLTIAKIIDKDYKTGTVVWNVPLYEGQNLEWGWVETEYRPLFRAVNKLAGGSTSSCLRKMQAFFAKHPSIRKDDVIAAAKMYIASVHDPTYLQQADYFIFKNSDSKSSFTSRLEQYLELLKESRKQANGANKMMGRK
mgnify:CR=1 FL=1